MKKHEMVLDFTSLLDVILILLFLVVCSMNNLAKEDAAEIEALGAQNEALSEQAGELSAEIEASAQELAALLEQYEQLELEKDGILLEYAQSTAIVAEALKQAEAAKEQLSKYEQMSGISGVDQMQFELFRENVDRMELICTMTGNKFCQMQIFLNDKQIGSETLMQGAANTEVVKGITGVTQVSELLGNLLKDSNQDIAVVSLVYKVNSLQKWVYDGMREGIRIMAEELQPDLTVLYGEVTQY